MQYSMMTSLWHDNDVAWWPYAWVPIQPMYSPHMTAWVRLHGWNIRMISSYSVNTVPLKRVKDEKIKSFFSGVNSNIYFLFSNLAYKMPRFNKVLNYQKLKQIFVKYGQRKNFKTLYLSFRYLRCENENWINKFGGLLTLYDGKTNPFLIWQVH